MSLKINDYVIKQNYHNSNINNEVKLTRDLTELLDIKKRYREFLTKANESKKFITNINNSQDNSKFVTNYPLRFKEGDGKYVLEVVDDESGKIMYSKSIFIGQSINVVQKIKSIKEEISKYNVSLFKLQTQNAIEVLRRDSAINSIKMDNNIISKEQFNDKKNQVDEDIVVLEESFNKKKSKLSDLTIELNILNKYLSDYIQKHTDYINRLNIDNINILWESISFLTDNSNKNLLNFHKLDRILHQNKDMYNGDLVIIHSDADLDDKENNFIGMIVENDEKKETIKIQLDNDSTLDIDREHILAIEGIHNLLKKSKLNPELCEVPIDVYNEQLSKIGIMVSKNRDGDIEIINNTPNKSITLQKKTINYGFMKKEQKPVKINVKKLQNKKAAVDDDDEEVENFFVDATLLYEDEGDVFMFYSKSARNPKPGKGARETLKTKENYDDLYIIEDWRKKLSNFWICDKPIDIIGKQFASVEHFFHFMKFWEIPGYSGEKKKQYDNHADNFTYNCSNPQCWGRSDGKVAKKNGGKLCGLKHRYNWFFQINKIISDRPVDDYTNMLLRNYILVVGLYHKFTQNEELKNLLLATKNALLIHPRGGNARTGVYLPEYPLMYVRYLIRNNKLVDMDILEKITTDRALQSPGSVSETKSASKSSDRSQKIYSSKSLSSQSPLSQLRSHAESLGLNSSKLSPKSLELAVNKEVSKMSLEEEPELINKLSQLLTVTEDLNKSILNVPPSGDCGYHAIVEMMNCNNIVPMNNDSTLYTDELPEYPTNKKQINVSITKEVDLKPILYDAMKKSRVDIADKFLQNFTLEKSEKEEIEVLKQAIFTDYPDDFKHGNTAFNKGIQEDYYNKIRNIFDKDGSWISDTELRLASALYNVDIRIYSNTGEQYLIESKHNRAVFTEGKEYNSDKEPSLIELGYYSNYHYVGLRNKLDPLLDDTFNKLTYYTVNIDLEGINYEVIFEFIGDDVYPLGLLNNNKTISYFTYEDDTNDEEIVTLFEDKYEDIEEADIKDKFPEINTQEYFKDILNNNIYLEPSNRSNLLGNLQIKTDSEGTIRNKINFILQ